MKKLKVFLVLLLTLTAAIDAAAQDYVIDVKHWDVEDGLSHRQVNCVYHACDGYVWVGTPNGLNRFDGYGFTWYTHERDSLPFNNIEKITEDANGDLWLFGAQKDEDMVCVFNPRTRQSRDISQLHLPVKHLFAAGAYRLADSSVMVWTVNERDNFTWHPRRGFQNVALPPEYHFIDVIPEQNCYLAQNDTVVGLVDMNGSMFRWRRAPFAKGSNCFHNTPFDRIVKDDATQKIYQVTADLEINCIDSVVPPFHSPGMDFIYATGVDDIYYRQGALGHLQKGILRNLASEDGGGTSLQRYVCADKLAPGRLWAATDFGLSSITISRSRFRKLFVNAYPDATRFLNSYRAIMADSSGVYGCNEAIGLVHDNGLGRPVLLVKHRPQSIGFFFVLRLADGRIAGSDSRSIYTVGGSNSVKRYMPPPSANMSFVYWCGREVRPGKLLLGMEEGMSWLDLTTGQYTDFEGYNNYPELAHSLILSVSPDRNGQLWICCNNGFYAYSYEKGVFARYSSRDTGAFFLPAREFQHFYHDKDGTYWLATAVGLLHWDKARGTSKMFTRLDGLSNDNIYGVFGDNDDRLWLSSNYGIMQFDKTTGNVKAYLTGDGITHNEFNRTGNFMASDGTIYFGSMNGITAFNPSEFRRALAGEKDKSPLAITLFEQFNGERNKLENRTADIIASHTITILPADRFFKLTFALLNFADPQQTTYFWKIDGSADSGWTSQKERTLHFSHLPYAATKLHVKAQSASGLWSDELVIALHVVKPFYLTTWFILLCTFSIAGLAIGVYWWRVYNFRRENQRLDMLVKEKTVALEKKTGDLQVSLRQKEILLAEVHHRVKNNLQMIVSLLELQSFSLTDQKAKEALFESQSRVMSMAIIHQKLYQDAGFDSVEIRSFAAELFSHICSLSSDPAKQVTLENQLPEKSFGIDTIIPLGLILNELITNSFKYARPASGETVITLTLTADGDGWLLQHRDNGEGIPGVISFNNSRTLGLQLVRRLSSQIGGEATYTKEGGSVFSIRFREV